MPPGSDFLLQCDPDWFTRFDAAHLSNKLCFNITAGITAGIAAGIAGINGRSIDRDPGQDAAQQ
jgi:hypothetical protein